MAENRPIAGEHVASRAEAFRDYEGVRREALRQYNSLLLNAGERLQAALRRVEQERTDAEPESVRELKWRIHELIEYLSEARL